MYVKLKDDHHQLPVSRRITASVEAHWAQRAKKTMIESATGVLNSGRPVSGQVAERRASLSRRSPSASSLLPTSKITPSEATTTSLAGNEARAAIPIPQSHPSGRTA